MTSPAREAALERLVEAARKWRDEHAYLPPPIDPPRGWVKEHLEQRKNAADALRAALDALPDADDGWRPIKAADLSILDKVEREIVNIDAPTPAHSCFKSWALKRVRALRSPNSEAQ